MLYLNPPFHIIEGVSLFPDHADPLQYYYLPLAPKLSTIKDTGTQKLIPQIQLIKYQGTAGNGGFLNFDVNLGIEEDILNKIRDKLRQLASLDKTPRLAPVPLIDGTVRLLLLGAQTQDVANPGDNNISQKFVLKIDQAAKPSLFGANQAAFSVMLDQYGVTVMEKALQGEMTPIGVVYSLDYLALRPAYSVRLKVDWERVQKHLDEQFSVDAVYTSIDIDKTVDKLIDERLIVLEADTFVPEGEENSAVSGRRDLAINQVRDMITDAFFQPSIDPIKEEKSGWDKAIYTADRASQLAVTGGWSSIGTFSYKKINYTRIDRKSLNVNISERTTVKRSIYPQGHLSGLSRTITKDGLDLNRFILLVNLDDPWFERRKITVSSSANFEEDLISSISVDLNYGNNLKSVLLDSSNAKTEVEWASIITNNAMQREVTTSYTVRFKNVDNFERPTELKSSSKVVNADKLVIDPRELYSITSIPIVARNFPWERYPHIEVQLKYNDVNSGIRIDDVLMLEQSNPEQTWKLFRRNPAQNHFRYKLIYRAANNHDIETSFVETDEEQVSIRDPRPNKRTLTIVPNFDWTLVKRAFVDLVYEDDENNVKAEQSFEFNKDDDITKTFQVDLENPSIRHIAYQATILFVDGRTVEIPPSITNERRIILRNDMRGHRIIFVHPDKIDFSTKGLKEIQVEMQYEDEEAGISFSDLFTFKSSNDTASFEFDFVDEQKSAYKFRITYLYLNGLSRTTAWNSDKTNALLLPVD